MYAVYPLPRLRPIAALSIGLAALCPVALARPFQESISRLEANKTVRQPLSSGQACAYEVALATGQFLKVVVEQRGIDVAVTVIGPIGQQVVEIDGERRTQGSEEVSLVADLSGVYKIKVEARQKGAPAGWHEIRIAEWRAGTQADRALQEARRLTAAFRKLYRAGRYDEARPLGERALALREQALGAEHPDVAAALLNLANFQRTKGNYGPAEALYQRALAVFEKAQGTEHPNVATALHNLAHLYREKGDYAQAEPLLQRALAIFEKALGAERPEVAHTLQNLATLYDRKGDYARAEPLFERAVAIFEKALGAQYPEVAQPLIGLAILYRNRGDYAQAEPLFERAATIFEKALGAEHPEVARALNGLANLYSEKGDGARAEPLFRRALAIFEKAQGAEHPNVATALNNLAVLCREKGDYAQAEALYQRALVIEEKALGAEHSLVAKSLNNLAILHRDRGDYARAVSCQARAVQINERNIALNLAASSERQKLAYLSTLSWEFNNTVALHARGAPDDPAARRLALTMILQRKGRALDTMADSIAALRRNAGPQDQALLDQLTSARSQLARLTFNGPGRTSPKQHQERVKQLADEVDRLEEQISRHSAEFRAQAQPVTLAAVQAAVPTDAALVEFAAYLDTGAAKGRQAANARYAAYVLRHQGEPQWVELGEAQAIDTAVAALREALRDPGRRDVRRQARTVDEKVMSPVRRLLGPTRHVLLSPDGALNLVPFAALVDEEGRYLVSRYSFTYLTSGRDLLRLREKAPSRRGVLVVANPDFGERAVARADDGDGDRRAVDFSQAYFNPLSGTEEEARALKQVFPDAQVLTGRQATEAALKQVAAPSVLHLATHGFFLKDGDFGSRPEEARGLKIRRGQERQAENPLLRSGLALAGSNQRQSGEEDGLLTALEAAGLHLWGTRLVVLSACDTGVGEVRNGDGVYGLRRALVLAGSESQVMSLWPVSDTGTRDLMIAYYKGLKAGQGRTAALRRVQLRMLRDPRRRHPFYWASFIQSGEWAGLDEVRK